MYKVSLLVVNAHFAFYNMCFGETDIRLIVSFEFLILTGTEGIERYTNFPRARFSFRYRTARFLDYLRRD